MKDIEKLIESYTIMLEYAKSQVNNGDKSFISGVTAFKIVIKDLKKLLELK